MIQRRDDKHEWAPVAEIRAAINGTASNITGGKEYHAAGATQATTAKNFTVKYHPALAALIPQNCRILYAGMTYDVKVIDDFEERHIELTFKTEANYGR